MQLKIVKYSIDDLIVDPKEVSENLNKLCSGRNLKWEITGLCQKGDIAVLALNQCDSLACDYFFAPVNFESIESIEQEIQSHWQSEIYLLGVIAVTENEHLALFRRDR